MDIKTLGYITIESTQPKDWLVFATQVVGMMETPGMQASGGDELFFKMDEYPWRIRVVAGNRDRLAIAGWELEDKAAFEQAVVELVTFLIP